MKEEKLIKSVLAARPTKELEKAVAAELAESDENEADEAETIEKLWAGAESDEVAAPQKD